MEFEWEESKRQKTLKERGVDFIDALLIWADPWRQERIGTRREYGEIRYQTIGKGKLGVLFVVYTIRTYETERPVNRIISARPANRKEIAQYEARIFHRGLQA